MNKFGKYSLFVLIIFLLLPIHTYAKLTDDNREEIFEFVKGAFQAQVALSEKERSIEEVHDLLTPYFTTSYMELFLKENLVEENQKYYTLGSDFALYYIPFFSYNDDTKIVVKQDQIYIFQYFPGNQEGPVTYQDHYEGILLEEEDGQFKVAKFLDKNPEKMIQLHEKEAFEHTQIVQPSIFSSLFFSRISVKTPFDFFLELRSYFK